MKISGRPVVGSGTIVLRDGETAEITIKNNLANLRFATDDGDPRVDIDAAGIVIFNMETATLGGFAPVRITMPPALDVNVRFAIWALGTPVGAWFVHFTITDF